MSSLRTAFFLAILALPFAAAHADDVTVDYNQLNGAPYTNTDAYATPAVTVSELPSARAPIHLHPLTASALTSPTVKNLAAEDRRAPIVLHPLAPQTVASLPIPPVPAPTISQPAAPVTNIDFSMAAVPPAKPVEAAAPAESQTAVANDVMPPTKAAQPQFESAYDKLAAVPVTPVDTQGEQPKPLDPTDDEGAVVPVNAVMNKSEDLNADDVVGFDYGHADKAGGN